jgi:hypothetical protein
MISKPPSSSHFPPASMLLLRCGVMLLASCSLLLSMAGCKSASQGVGDVVRDSMQSTFDKNPNFVNYHFKVDKVVATKKDDANYDGMATIQFQGQPHQVPIHITMDSNGNYEWKTGPTGLAFAAK